MSTLLTWLLIIFCILVIISEGKKKKKPRVITKSPTLPPTILTQQLLVSDGTLHDIEYVVALKSPTGETYCSGSVIGSSFVATSAGCILMNELERCSDCTIESKSHSYHIKYMIPYPRYGLPGGGGKDFGLIIIEGTFTEVQHLKVIGVEPPVGFDADFSGWGSDGIRAAKLSTAAKSEAYFFDQLVAINKDEWICDGAGGGPLTVAGIDDGIYLVGVASKGIDCANNVGIFTNVAKFNEWIEQIQKAYNMSGSSLESYTLASSLSLSASQSHTYQVYAPRGLLSATFRTQGGNTILKVQYEQLNNKYDCTSKSSSEQKCVFFQPYEGVYFVTVLAVNAVSGMKVYADFQYLNKRLSVTTASSLIILPKNGMKTTLALPVVSNFDFSVNLLGPVSGTRAPTPPIGARVYVGKGIVPPYPLNADAPILCSGTTWCSFTVPPDTSVVSVSVVGTSTAILKYNLQFGYVKLFPELGFFTLPYSIVNSIGLKYFQKTNLQMGSEFGIRLELLSGDVKIDVYFGASLKKQPLNHGPVIGVSKKVVLFSVAVPHYLDDEPVTDCFLVATSKTISSYNLQLSPKIKPRP